MIYVTVTQSILLDKIDTSTCGTVELQRIFIFSENFLQSLPLDSGRLTTDRLKLIFNLIGYLTFNKCLKNLMENKNDSSPMKSDGKYVPPPFRNSRRSCCSKLNLFQQLHFRIQNYLSLVGLYKIQIFFIKFNKQPVSGNPLF